MKHATPLATLAMAICCLTGTAQTKSYRQQIAQSIGIDCAALPADCDTVIASRQGGVRILLDAGQISHIGYDLFPAEIKTAGDREMLDYIETALLVQAHDIRIDGFEDVAILTGSIADVAKITSSTAVTITHVASKTVTVEWLLAEGRKLAVEASIGYQNVKGGTRTEIEAAFIAALTQDAIARSRVVAASSQEMVPYRDSLLLLPGESYQNPSINQSTYFMTVTGGAAVDSLAPDIVTPDSHAPDSIMPVDSVMPSDSVMSADGVMPVDGVIPIDSIMPADSVMTVDSVKPDRCTTVWDKRYPLESMANLMLYPDAKGDSVMIDITVLRHEYGEKTAVSVPLGQLLALSEQQGCEPFWGVEKYDGGVLVGALFLCNRQQGYNHVLKVSCRPADVIDGIGQITARASLFIPVNNIHNLFQPYRTKTDEERIKYN